MFVQKVGATTRTTAKCSNCANFLSAEFIAGDLLSGRLFHISPPSPPSGHAPQSLARFSTNPFGSPQFVLNGSAESIQ